MALYFLLPDLMGGQHPPPLWKFLIFTQNWDLRAGTAFSHAWSLCIEEQFYLVLPLAVAGGFWKIGHSWRAWIMLGALMLMGIAARTLLWSGMVAPLIVAAAVCIAVGAVIYRTIEVPFMGRGQIIDAVSISAIRRAHGNAEATRILTDYCGSTIPRVQIYQA